MNPPRRTTTERRTDSPCQEIGQQKKSAQSRPVGCNLIQGEGVFAGQCKLSADGDKRLFNYRLQEKNELMAKLTFLLSERKQLAEATMSFRFDLAGQSFPFQPGQFVRVGLPNPPHPDPKGNARSFSIASAPSDPFLLIACRMTGSAFKTSLAEVPLGTPVTVSGPAGSFILNPDSSAPVALFAGGIGITPFRSMIQHARNQKPARPLTLVYANRCPEQAAFLEELEAWGRNDSSFRLLATMTQPEHSKAGWNGPTGYVDLAFLRQHLPELPLGGCYVAGPPRFVSAVSQALREAGLAQDRLRTDEFTGYR